VAGRIQIAQLLAFVALVAALVGALGPAEDVRSTYAWPPPTLSGEPTRVWYTPLLLIRHRPESIAARVPCSLPPALPRAERPLLVLATARFPQQAGGLSVTSTRDRLVLSVAGEAFQRVALARGAEADCFYELRLAGGRWQLSGGPARLAASGTLESMPVVTGLFSALDLRRGEPPRIEVTTAVHRTEPLLRQTFAWTLGALCAFAALALVAFERRPRTRRSLQVGRRAAVTHAHPADGLVAIALLSWWVLSPTFLDDGWIIARERMFSRAGGFTNYFDAFGANIPNDYWLEWVQHWLADNSLLVARVPSLLCLAAVWLLCRVVLERSVRGSVGTSSPALWALASGFLAGALAWGMTVRPEPVTALFVVAVLVCIVRFLEREGAAPLALIALLLPFAFTSHHASFVALAPLVVTAPALLRWARPNVSAASAMVTSSIAVLTILLFVGADLDQRRADAETYASFGGGHNWRAEILRYAQLLEFPYGTPLRRASIALLALTLLAFLLRDRAVRRPLLDLPAQSLAVALVLFVAIPSKYAWHFGALVGLGAVALATETARLRNEAATHAGWRGRPFIVLGAAILASAWCWSPRPAWGPVDLRTLDWTPGIERLLPFATLSILLPVALLGGRLLVARSRRDERGLQDSPWRVASWIGPLVLLPLIVFTVGMLAADGLRTDSWTLARQNLGALTGNVGCGLADDLVVPETGSVRLLRSSGPDGDEPVPTWLPAAPVAGLTRFALAPTERASVSSRWFALPEDRRVGLYLLGTPESSDELALDWGRVRDGRIVAAGRDAITLETVPKASSAASWRFVTATELPDPPPNARLVRVTFRSATPAGSLLVATAPFAYTSERLTRVLAASESSLVGPWYVAMFPCVRLPRLSGGVVEPPSQIVVPRRSPTPTQISQSPFEGVLDLYPPEPLPIDDSPAPPSDVVVFAVDERIPGGALVPAREARAAS
jgi:hypothetical protein